jgi:hypothetical protein
MSAFVVVSVLLFLSTTAQAEIVAWVDDDGVHHYTNNREDVPKAYRDSVRTVVKDMPVEDEAPPANPVSEDRRRDLERLAQVVSDRAVASEEYVRGYLDGVARAQDAGRGGDVRFEGPLAVAHANASPYIQSYYPYYDDPYPFVTTAFDRGRSRHLTLRMLLQDQFQLDRGAPYIYSARYLSPRLGVDLNPFHPRGLPRRFPRDTRVLLR